jgi:hypothetical protein
MFASREEDEEKLKVLTYFQVGKPIDGSDADELESWYEGGSALSLKGRKVGQTFGERGGSVNHCVSSMNN